jgi:hypothetical protein
MWGGLVGILSSWTCGLHSYLPWSPSLSSPSSWSPLCHCPSGWCCGPSSASAPSSCCPCPCGSGVLWWWWSCSPHPHCLLLLFSLVPRSSSSWLFVGGSGGLWVVPVVLSLLSWLSWLWSCGFTLLGLYRGCFSYCHAPPPHLCHPCQVVNT